jgi:hypothetical protein
MSPLPDNRDPVQRLLACKRYEQPPPGYFLSFSEKVLARIEAEEASVHSSWWGWFVAKFDARPVVVCAYGVAVSSMLFVGFSLSAIFEAEISAAPTSGSWLAGAPPSPLLLTGEWSHAPPVEGTPAAFSSIVRPSAVNSFSAVRLQFDTVGAPGR